jgi:uncharacterized membrane protein YkoI
MNRYIILLLAALFVAAGWSTIAAASERDVALSQVPAAVLAAATNAVPGIKITEAELEDTEKGQVYELEGVAGGKSYEVKVSADATDVQVQQGDD